MSTNRLAFNPEPLPAYHNYARTLRVIGQDLTQIYPEDLEIQVLSVELLATGIGLAPAPQVHKNKGSVSRRVWNRFTGRKLKSRVPVAPLHRATFTRKYDLYAINRLDEIGLASRRDKTGKPDIYSLGERLRTVGRIVDGRGGTLIRIVKDRNSMKFEYRDQNGINQREEYTNLALYKYQQRYYAERGMKIIDKWDDSIG